MDLHCDYQRHPNRNNYILKINPSFTQRFAVPIIALSSLLVSVNGLIVRSFENANDWQIVFSRNLFFFPITMVLLWISARGKLTRSFLQMGWIGIVAGIFLGLANTTIILALEHTTVANALFTLSAYPLITAVLARIFLGEIISRATLIAIAIAMTGISIMVSDGLRTDSPVGILITLSCALFFSLFVIYLRYGEDRNMLPASAIGELIGIADRSGRSRL